jgi:hypothetical protein
LAFVYLLAVAGVIHRADEAVATHLELRILSWTVGLLWPIFAVEAIVGLFYRHPVVPFGKALLRTILILIFPPARMAMIDPSSGRFWLPRWGWCEPSKHTLKQIDRSSSGIMLVFAALILPILGFEYAAAEQVANSAALRFAVDFATAVIWVMFASEFLIKSVAAPAFFRFALSRWLELAIVILPALEFLLTQWAGAAPVMRLLRLQKAMSPQALARMGKLYRMRGVMMRGWQAVLMAGGLARLMGQSPQKRLAAIEATIEELEEQLTTLRAEAEEIRRELPLQGESASAIPTSAWSPPR